MLIKRTEWALNSFENRNKYLYIFFFYLIAPLSSQDCWVLLQFYNIVTKYFAHEKQTNA